MRRAERLTSDAQVRRCVGSPRLTLHSTVPVMYVEMLRNRTETLAQREYEQSEATRRELLESLDHEHKQVLIRL